MQTTEKEEETLSGNKITEGIIWKQLLLFFFPILLGTFFQQLYNAADAVVVGRFVGKEALSAVGGTTGALIQLLVGFFIGLSSGATVIISQYYGARKKELVGSAVHTSIAFCLIAGIFLMITGIAAAPAILEWMGTPEDILGFSVTYIRIYFIGIIPNLIYNMGAGILRAVGDSKRPLYFLMISCMVNIVLDMVLVVGLHMGVAGAAIATIVSQLLSAVLIIMVLIRTEDMYKLRIKSIRIERNMLEKIIRIGFPAGLQSIMYSASNVIIQTSVNSLGTDTVAAWTAYGKIDSIFWMIISAFGISVTTFVGQNYGAGKKERVHQGIRVCMIMSFATTIFISVILYFWGSFCYSLFTTDEAVIRIGTQMLRFLVPVYFTYVAIEIFSGALRGVGDCWIPMLITCIGICLIRVLWNVTAVPAHRTIEVIMSSYPITWVITTLAFCIYYRFFSVLKKR